MRINNTKVMLLRNLKLLLRQACHSPKCNRTSTCPRQCSCRNLRKFELNTDTAICWEIAELLMTLQRCETVNKAYIKEIRDKIRAYAEVSRHHSSKGWEDFFWDVERAYVAIMDEQDAWPDPSPENRIENLKYRINRLKRYPK